MRTETVQVKERMKRATPPSPIKQELLIELHMCRELQERKLTKY